MAPRIFALLLIVVLLAPALAFQEKDKPKEDPKPTPKLRGMLPPNYKKLGLSEEQKQRVYKIQADYRDMIDALQAKIEKLKKEQREKIEGVLTPGQVKRLQEIRDGK